MELDDLKRRWEEQDRKLDASLRLNARVLKESVLGRAELAIRRMSRGLLVELLVGLLPLLWLGSFIADHIGEPRFWIPAAALDVCAIALVIALVRLRLAIRSVDYAAPILGIQKRLESIRVRRIRATLWTLALAALAWTPLLIVGLKGFLDVDAYAVFSAGWLVANVLFGLAVLAAAVWVSRRFADRMERSPLLQRLMRDLAGRNLADAEGFLGSLARFEQNEGLS